MTKFTLIILVCFIFLALSNQSAVGQQNKELVDLAARIAEKEAKSPDTMPDILKYAHIQNLTRLYREYIAKLDEQLAVRGLSKSDKALFEGLRGTTGDKLAIFEEFLGQGPVNAQAAPVANVKPVPLPKPPKPDVQPGEGGKPVVVKPPTKPPLAGGDQPAEGEKPKPKSPQAGGKTAEQPLTIDTTKDQYKTATDFIRAKATTIARQFLLDKNDTQLDEFNAQSTARGSYTVLLPFVIARSIEPADDKSSAIVNLQPLEFLPESYRTDKQIGSSATTIASTSAIDKPGFANLLGVAIENGFIEGNVRDTVLTLSTSPSAFYSIGRGDRAKAYQNAGFLNKIGLSASFNVNEKTPLLNNVSTGQLKEFSVRYRFWGDHSARSPKLHQIWKDTVEPKVLEKLLAVGQILDFVDTNATLREFRNANTEQFGELLDTTFNSDAFKALSTAEKETQLTNFVLNFLKATVADKIGSGININDDVQNALRAKVAALVGVQRKEAFDVIKQHLDEFFKTSIGTVAYISNRDPMGNYSQLKLLLGFSDTIFKPLSLTLNAGMSFYNKPNVMMNQERIRDFDFALSFEGKRTVSYLRDEDFSPITYSFTGRYQRLLENQKMANRKADLLKAQFLITFPLFSGVSLPFSATYFNATEMEKKQGFRINFGLKFDADKFFDLSRLKKVLP